MAIEDIKRSELLDILLSTVFDVRDATTDDRVLFLQGDFTLPKMRSATMTQLLTVLNTLNQGTINEIYQAIVDVGDVIVTSSYFIVSVSPNTLTAYITPLTDITYTHYIITVDDDTPPTYPTNYISGTVAATKVIDAWEISEVWRLWVYDFATSTRTEILAPDGSSGVTVTPNATAPPIRITDFDVPSGTVTETTAPASFTATTIVDSTPLTYDIINNDTSVIVNADVTPGSITITGLSPATTYNLAVNVYPTSNINGTTSRASISNVEAITTDGIGTITGFSVDNVATTGEPYIADILTFTVSDGVIDEGFLKVDDPSPPASNDANWDTIANWLSNGINVGSVGAHTIYVWARDGSFPTSYTAVDSDTMTATDTEIVTVVGFVNSAMTAYEERAGTAPITINRTGNTSGVSTVKVTSSAGTGTDPAVAGVNYQLIDSVVTFSAGETTASVDCNLLWANLGFSTASWLLTLSDPTGATLDSNQTTLDITIEGTKGYWSLPGSAAGTRDGDIDVFNPPFLPAYIGSTTLNDDSSETIEYVTIDAGGAEKGLSMLAGAQNKTIENCIIKNANAEGIYILNAIGDISIRNCFFQNNGSGSTQAWFGAGIYVYGGGGADPQRISILGNRFENNDGAVFMAYMNTDDFYCNWNYHRNEGPSALKNNWNSSIPSDRDNRYGKSMSLLTHSQMAFTGYECIGNIVYMPELYDTFSQGGFEVDCISNQNVGHDSGSPGEIKFNMFNTNTLGQSSSGRTIILGDASDGRGYSIAKYNTVFDSAGINFAGGRNQVISYNDCYFAKDPWHGTKGGIGLTAHRSRNCPPGEFYNASAYYNRVLSYKDTGTPQNWWKNCCVGSDQPTPLVPNHGSVAGGNEEDILGWMDVQTNQDMESSWGNGAGETIVGGRRVILNQPAYDDGIYVMYASYGAATGDGRLTFTSGSPDTLSWAEYNDSVGAAVDLDDPLFPNDERFELYSGNGNFITVHVTSADLPVADTVWTVNVTKFKWWEISPYVGPTGVWVGVTGDTPDVDVTPPTIPVNGAAASASATSLALTWDQSTDAADNMGGYYVYRSATLIATISGDPASPSYTDTGTDLPAGGLTEDQVYSYQISAYDTIGNVSERSEWFSGTPSAGTNLITNGEFVDTTGWTAKTNTTFEVNSGPGGVAKITSIAGGVPTAGIHTTSTVTVTANTAYTLTVAHLGRYNQPVTNYREGRIVIATTTNAWISDMASGGSQVLQDATMTEHDINFTTDTGQTAIYVILWINAQEAGTYTEYDYVRLIGEHVPVTPSDRIQPYSTNPWYWEYDGSPTLLLGGSIHSNILSVADIEDHLDEIQAAGGNYIISVMGQRLLWNLPGNMDRPYAWNGTADLDTWNSTYWTKFSNLLSLCNDRDIIVQIELWDRWDFVGQSWLDNSFRPANNVNYTTGESGLSDSYSTPDENHDFFRTPISLDDNSLVLAYQEAFVDKILSYSFQYSNILYVVGNESDAAEAWGKHWADYINTAAGEAVVDVETAQMWDDRVMNSTQQKLSFDHPETYSFLDLAQNSHQTNQTQWDGMQYARSYIIANESPLPMNHGKTYGSNDGGTRSENDAIESFWRNIIGGAASCRFHRPPAGLGILPLAKNLIAGARLLETKVTFWDMAPDSSHSLLSDRASDEAYLCYEAGLQYALYFTNGGAVGLDLSSYGGTTFDIDWVDIENGTWGTPDTVAGGSTQTITAPTTAHWVAAIVPQ